MRLRANHIVFFVLALIAGFVLLTVQMQPQEETASVGSLPPEGADPSLVPDVDIETRDKHLGTVPNDQLTRAPFLVYNRGKAPLELRSIRTSCACTQGEIPPGSKTIAPGKSAPLTIIFDPARVPGFHSTKQLTLFTNDLDTPQVDFEVTAEIAPEFTMTSRDVDFGGVSKRDLPTHTLLLRQAQEKPFTITDVQPRATENLPGANELVLDWNLRPESEWAQPAMREYSIDVALPPDVTPGEVTRLFDIYTDIPRLRRLPVLVKADVAAPYRIQPAFPQTVSMAPGKRGEATISATEPITVESIEADSALLQVRAEAAGDGSRVILAFGIADTAPAGPFTAIVRFSVRTRAYIYPDKVAVRGVVMPANP